MPKRNAFGQIILPPFLRFTNEPEGGGGGSDKQFTPPADQEALDKLINAAVGRAHKQYEGLKDKADKWDAHEATKANGDGKSEGDKSNDDNKEKPAGVSENDVDARIEAALAAKDKELAIERISDRIDKALEGRTVSASKLFSLDRSQFIKEDGKTVDTEKLQKWVDDNSAEGPTPSRRIRAQGERDANATGGSVSAGRERYEESHKKKSRKD